MEIGTIISLIALLAGGVTVWVNINQRVTKLESVNESQEKRIDHLDKKTGDEMVEMRKLINDGFTSIRDEMKADRKEMQATIMNLISNK